MLRVIQSPERVQHAVDEARARGLTIGLVPTMGCLHEGHMELVRRAREKSDWTIVSIFVNPLQFGPAEDYERYPRNLMRDEKMCREEGVEAIFAPDGSRMFPDGFRTKVRVEGLSEPLCGAHRPGHFDGVATVVLKLFNIVRPDVAFFGEKDYQQLQVIRQMTLDLDLDVRIESVPIVREADGLAMSSRNAYLSPEERGRALCLSRSLDRAQALVAEGVTDAARILSEVRAIQEAAGAKIEYAELRDAETLETRNKVTKPTLLALAAHFGATRLIDNRILGG